MKTLSLLLILLEATTTVTQTLADTEKWPYYLVTKLYLKDGSALYNGTGMI